MAYEIKLDVFEGPLDLLLYLIRKNEIDIYNIPIALIADQYLKYLEIMRSFNLDLAGEYLVLASTLIHIKSRMLLPGEEDGAPEEEQDPRAELVRQLLDYQTYKEAAASLDTRLLLDRDVFKRGHPLQNADEKEDEDTAVELSLFDLVEAFHKIVSQLDKAELLEIDGEKMSLTDRINEIMEKLLQAQTLTFTDLLEECGDRRMIIYTLLAILELTKLRMINAYQYGPFGVIRMFPAGEEVVENS
ncbi:MAG: chromosome segregation protein ScpA [Syntrophobacteraceae bacterium CG23_combo_of_CG06-09_8_20_14_all_50_8]|nr:MAG: chromosome segregation protein ScpA [Syntrophobacteraceae bacterium CG23_combo_of_CG06-09_8_20_14_all_50_8]